MDTDTKKKKKKKKSEEGKKKRKREERVGDLTGSISPRIDVAWSGVI